MTIHHILIESPIDQLDTELLIAYILKKPREYVVTHKDTPLPLFTTWRIRRLITKRNQGIPLAYLTGHKNFFGLDFLVNKHTLVPRPDTEVLVEVLVERIRNQESGIRNILLIDVGAGSGCIPISIMKTYEHLNIKTFAIDISRRALRMAKKNAKQHGAPITFLHGNLLKPILKKLKIKNLKFKIFLTANLPYLTEEQFSSEASIHHEPKSALVAKNNGLALYEELLQQAHQLMAYDVELTAFFEIDPSQTTAIQILIRKHFPDATIEIKKDLAGLDRVVMFCVHTPTPHISLPRE